MAPSCLLALAPLQFFLFITFSDPKKPLLGQQHFDQAPALHADPYPQLSAHPRPGQKYGATGQTPTSSHVGLSHARGRGKNNLECGIQPDRAPESSSSSTGRHAVTMADGCVLPVDPPNADRRVSHLLVDSSPILGNAYPYSRSQTLLLTN